MKLLLVSNGNLAQELYQSMKRFYANPEIDYLCLEDAKTEAFAISLRKYIHQTKGELLILCDFWGSAAFIEAACAASMLHVSANTGIICGVSLPMVFKVYGLKDCWSVNEIRALYDDRASEENGIILYRPQAC